MLDRFNDWADHTGDNIIKWARPEDFPVESYTEGWALTKFRHALLIAICYLTFVCFGSFIMRFLPAIDLSPVKFFYNVSQVMLCSYMCIEAGLIAYRNDYSLIPCVAFNHTKPVVAELLWIFYASKVFDFFDTIFIITGKKWSQLSFLHVYHHTSIFLFYWLNMNVGYDGDIYLTILLNGFIHMMMYLYYFLTLHMTEPKENETKIDDKKDKRKGVWWKPIVTFGQEIQFVLMISQAVYMISTSCRLYPIRIIQVYAGYIASLLVLFINFSLQNYGSKKDKGKKAGSENVVDVKKKLT